MCSSDLELLRAKAKDVQVKVYSNAHHGFDTNPSSIFRGKTKMTFKDYGHGKCYFEENTDSSVLNEENLGEGFHQQITQVGFNEFLASITEKKKKKLFKYTKSGNKHGYTNPFILFDDSCITRSSTLAYNKDAAEEAAKLIKDFFITTFKL